MIYGYWFWLISGKETTKMTFRIIYVDKNILKMLVNVERLAD